MSLDPMGGSPPLPATYWRPRESERGVGIYTEKKFGDELLGQFGRGAPPEDATVTHVTLILYRGEKPIVAYQQIDQFGTIVPVFGAPTTIDGFRLVDGRASYGFGLESFLLGFPMHFDWSWKTLFNKDWENALYSYQGFLQGESGSEFFRRVKFSFWIGYDF